MQTGSSPTTLGYLFASQASRRALETMAPVDAEGHQSPERHPTANAHLIRSLQLTNPPTVSLAPPQHNLQLAAVAADRATSPNDAHQDDRVKASKAVHNYRAISPD